MTPTSALAAIFPLPVVSGPYTLQPPTLLHLAAIDRLGIALYEGRIGAAAAAAAGFILTRTPGELRELMTRPDDEVRASAAGWADHQPALNLEPLRQGVIAALNAAFSTAVPGDDKNPTPGQPRTSAGPSKLPRPSPSGDGAGTPS